MRQDLMRGRGPDEKAIAPLVLVLVSLMMCAPQRSLSVTVAQPAPGTFAGNGFDACSAPSSGTLDAWLASNITSITRLGDSNRDGHEDVIAGDSSTGAWAS